MRSLVADSLSSSGLEILRDGGRFEVAVADTINAHELLDRIPDFHALVVRSRTKVTRDVIARGAALRVIGRCGVGLDNIDVAAARERGVAVVSAAGASAVSVAELTLGLMISLVRRIPEADASVRAGKWERSRFMGSELSGKTLGLIGLGNIGREVALRARAFGMDVIYHDPYLPPAAAAGSPATVAPLKALLETADIISIHIPLSDETRYLISVDAFERMKTGAFLLNVSRGGIVDEAALLAALRGGRLAGAALDVFEMEPPERSDITSDPRVIVCPHIGASTKEAQERAGIEVARRVVEILRAPVN
ncbi:MAG: hydroxyacid dehydrogenase [bacterium]